MSSANGEEYDDIIVIAALSMILIIILLIFIGYGYIRLQNYVKFLKHIQKGRVCNDIEIADLSEYQTSLSETYGASVENGANSHSVPTEFSSWKASEAKSTSPHLSSEASWSLGLKTRKAAPYTGDHTVKGRESLTAQEHSDHWDLASSSDTGTGSDEKTDQLVHRRQNDFPEMLRSSFYHSKNADDIMPEAVPSLHSQSFPSTPELCTFCPMYSPDNGSPWGLCPLLYQDFP